MTTPTSELNRIAVDLNEAELWTLATIVREYAALIKTYADAVAENARLKAAMDKYSEDEMLLIERCAVRGRIAQLEGKLVDVEIRALKVEK